MSLSLDEFPTLRLEKKTGRGLFHSHWCIVINFQFKWFTFAKNIILVRFLFDKVDKKNFSLTQKSPLHPKFFRFSFLVAALQDWRLRVRPASWVTLSLRLPCSAALPYDSSLFCCVTFPRCDWMFLCSCVSGAGVFFLSCSEGEQISFLFDCMVRGVSPSRARHGRQPKQPGESAHAFMETAAPIQHPQYYKMQQQSYTLSLCFHSNLLFCCITNFMHN